MDFVSFARAHGVEIRDLEMGVRVYRCGTVDHPRSDNGAYSWDGKRGWVMAWDGDGLVHWFNDESQPWTAADKVAANKRREQQRRQNAEKQRRAALKAEAILTGCELKGHTYLRIKGFPNAMGLVTADGELVVPMRALAGDLVGAQLIWSDPEGWHKKMIYGMRAKGAVLRLGDHNARETWLVEGYATGLSVAAALAQMHLRACVLACFSADNLTYVAGLIGGKRFVAADHDESGKGEAAAKATGLPYCMPENAGDDWNDAHVLRGLAPLREALRATRMQEVVEA